MLNCVVTLQVVEEECPLYSKDSEPYNTEQLLNILHSNDRMCKKAPIPIFANGVPTNCCFKVDSKIPRAEILSSSNAGTWIPGGAPFVKVIMDSNKVRSVTVDEDGRAIVKTRVGNKWKNKTVPIGKVLLLQRVYSSNKNNTSFRRVFVTLTKYDDDSVKYPSLIHYYWVEGDKHFTLKPHGNATGSTPQPYIRSKPSVLQECKRNLSSSTPAKVYRQTFSDAGGIDAEDFSNSLRNKTQVYNIGRKSTTEKDQLADVIQQQQKECVEGPQYVRKVVIDPACGPMCINYTDQQVKDMCPSMTN